MTGPLDLAAGVVGLGTAIAKAADRPDDVDRAAFIRRARKRLSLATREWERSKRDGPRRDRLASSAEAHREALRAVGVETGPLPWEPA